MKLGKTLAVLAAATLATAPLAAQSADRAVAPVEGESSISEYSILVIVAILGLAAGVVASGNDEDFVPASP